MRVIKLVNYNTIGYIIVMIRKRKVKQARPKTVMLQRREKRCEDWVQNMIRIRETWFSRSSLRHLCVSSCVSSLSSLSWTSHSEARFTSRSVMATDSCSSAPQSASLFGATTLATLSNKQIKKQINVKIQPHILLRETV